jgi:hypothetical protein
MLFKSAGARDVPELTLSKKSLQIFARKLTVLENLDH